MRKRSCTYHGKSPEPSFYGRRFVIAILFLF